MLRNGAAVGGPIGQPQALELLKVPEGAAPANQSGGGGGGGGAMRVGAGGGGGGGGASRPGYGGGSVCVLISCKLIYLKYVAVTMSLGV